MELYCGRQRDAGNLFLNVTQYRLLSIMTLVSEVTMQTLLRIVKLLKTRAISSVADQNCDGMSPALIYGVSAMIMGNSPLHSSSLMLNPNSLEKNEFIISVHSLRNYKVNHIL